MHMTKNISTNFEVSIVLCSGIMDKKMTETDE